MIPTTCGICGEASKLAQKEVYQTFTLFECATCHGQFWSPMKNPGSAWYTHDDRYSSRNAKPLMKPEREHRRFLERVPARGRLLDIGMGTGNFLAAAQRAGWSVVGTDFDEEALNTARSAFGLADVYPLDAVGTRAKFGDASFDAVTFFQVLEHVEDPRAFLAEVKALLKQGGTLSLSTPNRTFADFMKPGDKPPRHLSRWSKESLTDALKRAGFTDIVVEELSVPWWYLIKRFHFWTRGFLSFGMVGKVAAGEVKKKTNTVQAGPSLKVRLLLIAAKAKDQILFAIPAILLFLFLFVQNKHRLDLFAVAHKP